MIELIKIKILGRSFQVSAVFLTLFASFSAHAVGDIQVRIDSAINGVVARVTGGHRPDKFHHDFPANVAKLDSAGVAAVNEMVPIIDRMSDSELLKFIVNSRLLDMKIERSTRNGFYSSPMTVADLNKKPDNVKLGIANELGLGANFTDAEKILFVKNASLLADGTVFTNSSVYPFGFVLLGSHAYLSLAQRTNRIFSNPDLKSVFLKVAVRITNEGVNPRRRISRLLGYVKRHESGVRGGLGEDGASDEYPLDAYPEKLLEPSEDAAFSASLLPDPKLVIGRFDESMSLFNALVSQKLDMRNHEFQLGALGSYFLNLKSSDPRLSALQMILEDIASQRFINKGHRYYEDLTWSPKLAPALIAEARATTPRSSVLVLRSMLSDFENGKRSSNQQSLFEAVVNRLFVLDFDRDEQSMRKTIRAVVKYVQLSNTSSSYEPNSLDRLMSLVFMNASLDKLQGWVEIFKQENATHSTYPLSAHVENRVKRDLYSLQYEIVDFEVPRLRGAVDIANERLRKIQTMEPKLIALSRVNAELVRDFRRNIIAGTSLERMPLVVKSSPLYRELNRRNEGSAFSRSQALVLGVMRPLLKQKVTCESLF